MEPDFNSSNHFWAQGNQHPKKYRQETLLNKSQELQDLSQVNIVKHKETVLIQKHKQLPHISTFQLYIAAQKHFLY